MLKGYRYRLYPTDAQAEMLNKHTGCCRFLYNYMLERKKEAYEKDKTNLSCNDLINLIPALKKEKEFEWLSEVDSQCLQQSVINMHTAFTNFFKKRADFPKKKKKSKGNQKYRSPHGSKVKIENHKLYIPKFAEGITVVQVRPIKGAIKSATISRVPSGKYYVSILADTTDIIPQVKKQIKQDTTVGIDLGLKYFAVTSDGKIYENPRYLKSSLQRLKVLQRRLSRKKTGSNNRRKAKLKVAILHEYIANQRQDFLHKLTTELVKNQDSICIEDLAVGNMMKNHCLAQAIGDVGWGRFREFLTYKCEWYGKNLLIMPRFEASTKVCGNCGAKNDTLTLKDRNWTCATCLTDHDRDINAAKVIKQFCLKNSASGEGIPKEPVESLAIAGTKKK